MPILTHDVVSCATRRTANHDAFGLAVLVFHLLFMGRHPFARRFLGKGGMPIERALAECRFAYSAEARRTAMTAPPFAPPMQVVGRDVTELFERAFHPDGRSGGRPSPEQWIDALDNRCRRPRSPKSRASVKP